VKFQVVLALIMAASALAGIGHAQEAARLPAAAGSHYPAEPANLLRTVRKFTTGAGTGDLDSRLALCLVPHDPYGLAGDVIGKTLGTIQPGQYDQVIVIAPSYFESVEGCVMPDTQAYLTPFGPVPIDETALRTLGYSALFSSGPVSYDRRGRAASSQAREFAIEVLLPFLQDRIGLFRLVPIFVGDLRGLNGKYDPTRVEAIADAIKEVMSPKSLIVCTAHFTQYRSPEGSTPGPDIIDRIEDLDGEAIRLLLQRKPDEFEKYLFRTNNDFNSPAVMHLMLRLLPKNTVGEVREYTTSARITGKQDRSISYAGLAFYDLDHKPTPPNPERRLTPSDPAVLEREQAEPTPDPVPEPPSTEPAPNDS
jgi:hypothetical protein